MKAVVFEPATAAHAVALAPNLRPECLRDVLALGYPDALDGLLAGFASEMSFAALLDGEVLAMFGASESGEVWVLTSNAVLKHPRAFLRCCRPGLALLWERCGHLTNYVDARFEDCIRWLEWLGCELGPVEMHAGRLAYPVTLLRGV